MPSGQEAALPAGPGQALACFPALWVASADCLSPGLQLPRWSQLGLLNPRTKRALPLAVCLKPAIANPQLPSKGATVSMAQVSKPKHREVT